MSAPVEAALRDQLSALPLTYLGLLNESADHAHYQPGAETHFKLTMVSDAFSGLSRVKRHQQVYQLVNHLLTASGGQIHALAIHTYTPEEWAVVKGVPDSPNCVGKR